MRYTQRVAKVRTFTIERTWQGKLLDAAQRTAVHATVESERAMFEWDAPWPRAPLPSEAPGELWGLWEYPVVEIFLASVEGPYVEFEFGPIGHWLALYLTGYRHLERRLNGVTYRTRRDGERWRGQADVRLPESHQWCSGNAYFIDGQGQTRVYAAASSVDDVAPDFHRSDCYLTL